MIPQERTWQDRAVEATRGNKTVRGAVLLAMLSRSGTPPCFGRTATITKDGWVHSTMVHKSGRIYVDQIVCYKQDMIDGFRELADTLKFTDQERTELLAELRKWIARDDSAEYDVLERIGFVPKRKIHGEG